MGSREISGGERDLNQIPWSEPNLLERGFGIGSSRERDQNGTITQEDEIKGSPIFYHNDIVRLTQS